VPKKTEELSELLTADKVEFRITGSYDKKTGLVRLNPQTLSLISGNIIDPETEDGLRKIIHRRNIRTKE
tara:strand:- start:403 stop:609 length:207 start_codon:yes stop_codon:yes gene_type:complete